MQNGQVIKRTQTPHVVINAHSNVLMGFHDGQYGYFPPKNTQLQNLQTSKICLYTILAMLQSGYPLTWPRAQQHKGCHWAQ
jgi:hypothetical protein